MWETCYAGRGLSRMTSLVSSIELDVSQKALRPGRWVEVMSHTDPKYGGLSSAVPALSEALAHETEARITLEAFCNSGEAAVPHELLASDVGFWPTSRRQWMSGDVRSRFSDVLRGANGVHIHGLWESSTAVAAEACRELHIPYVLSAHGMLEPWALRSARIKKLIYSHLIERRNVRGAACLHALTRNEAAQYRAFGAHSPIAVIANGVSLPAHSDAELFFSRFPELRGKRILLFLARLHPKKGLEWLVESWRSIAANLPDAHLVIAGPDFEGTRPRLETVIQRKQLQGAISFAGMLRGEEKWSALSAAECFVLPSYSEGLSISVLEALGVGRPVIVTDACNMPEVEENRCGWQIPVSADSLTKALQELFSNSLAENRILGCRGAELIQNRYTWPQVARQMARGVRVDSEWRGTTAGTASSRVRAYEKSSSTRSVRQRLV